MLRPRATGLVHRHPLQEVRAAVDGVEVVLISHLHHDHLDLPSLKLVPAEAEVLVPAGGGELLRRAGIRRVREVMVGQAAEVRDLTLRATPARHNGFRLPFGPAADSLGYLIGGTRRIYFAGDTDLFPRMADLAPLDVALLPVAGWGPKLGPGHMGPLEAVQALELLRPRIVIPIHWGTLVPIGLHLWTWPYLTRPPRFFADLVRQRQPHTEVRILEPGQTLDLTA